MTIAAPGASRSDAGPQRHLPLPGTSNLRDVGGYPARGGSVRWRTLLRSDALHRLTGDGRAVLAGLGLRRVVDLRSSWEIERAPDALDGLGVTTVLAPVFPESLPAGAQPPRELAEIYRFLVDHGGSGLTAAVAALAGATPALVHCTVGKDRTGLVIALVLELAGVADEDIAADYALTGQYLDAVLGTTVNQLAQGLAPAAVRDAGLLASPPELILDTLRYLRARYGSAREYLTGHGAPEGALDQLITALVG
jgi:protein-tyrosine phosphatase